MRYWLVKGNPREFDLNEFVQRGEVDTWRTRKPPKDWSVKDRVFFWSSAPRLELVALGVFLGTTGEFSKEDETLYDVKYLTNPMANPIPAATLRGDSICADANFLKPAVAQGVLQVTEAQAHQMYRLLRRVNDGQPNCWRDVPNPDAGGLVDVDEEFAEGGQEMRNHLVRERNPALVKRKRDLVLHRTGKLVCEACNFDFALRYGELGYGFCEVHHNRPLAAPGRLQRTKLSELAIVCSNCHRMLHRAKNLISIRKLRNRLVDA